MNDHRVTVLSDEAIDEALAAMEREQATADARFAMLQDQFPAAIRTLINLANSAPEKRYGIAAAELVRAAHRKQGTVELSNLRSMDADNLAAALIVIESIANPSMLSDRGLGFDGYGEPRLTAEEVARIPD